MSNAFSGGAPTGSSGGLFSRPQARGPPASGGFGTGGTAFSGQSSTFGSSSKPSSGGFNPSGSPASGGFQPRQYGGPGPQENSSAFNGSSQWTPSGSAQPAGPPRGGFYPGNSDRQAHNTGGYGNDQQKSGGFQGGGNGYQGGNNNSQPPAGGLKTNTSFDASTNNGAPGYQGQINGGGSYGGYHGGGHGGYQGSPSKPQQTQNQQYGGFNNTGGYGGEQQQHQQYNTGYNTNSSFHVQNDEDFQQMPQWNANSQQNQAPHQQQPQFEQQYNGSQSGGFNQHHQAQNHQQPQQRGGFQPGNTGGYGAYQGQQQQPVQNNDFNAAPNARPPQYGGFGKPQQQQQQSAQPGLFSQHRGTNSASQSSFNQHQNTYTPGHHGGGGQQEFQNQQANFAPSASGGFHNQQNSGGYQQSQQKNLQNQSVFSREAGFQNQREERSTGNASGGYGARSGFHGASGAPGGGSSGGFQQGNRDFVASGASGGQSKFGGGSFGQGGGSQGGTQKFEARADWDSNRSSPASQTSGGSFGGPRKQFGASGGGGGFGGPARRDFEGGQRGPRRNQQELGFSDFGDNGAGAADQQGSRGGGGRPFGENGEQRQEGEGENKPERAPRDWMPKQEDIDQLYALDHDVVDHLESGADDEPLEFHNGEDRPIHSWDNMGLDEHLIRVLKEKCRFVKPRKIQASIIPLIATGKDLIVQAVTGSGKTLAFVLPILDKIMKLSPAERKDNMRSPVAIVLEPTRELAGQIYDSFRRFTEGTDIKVVLSIGQKCRVENLKEIVGGVDVLVATPGRTMDFFEHGELSFDRLAFFVLDEADRLLDRKNSEHLDAVIKSAQFLKTSDNRQTFLFSATLPTQFVELAFAIMRKEHICSVKNSVGRKTNSLVQHEFYQMPGAKEKHVKIRELLEKDKAEGRKVKTLIFTERCVNANFLAFEIIEMKIVEAAAISGDAPQDTRDAVYNRFRNGDLPVLIATDVASRGLDINNLDRVIQYDLPSTKFDGPQVAADRFINRVGRTGRNRKGVAVTFVEPNADPALLKEICQIVKNCNQTLPNFLIEAAEAPAPATDNGTFGSAAGAGFGSSGGFGNGFGSKAGGGNSGFGAGNSGFGNSGGYGTSNAGGFGSSSNTGGFGTTSAPTSGTFGNSGGFGMTSGANSGGFGGGGFGSFGGVTSSAQDSGFGGLKLKAEPETSVKEAGKETGSDGGFGTSGGSAFAPKATPAFGSTAFGSSGFGSSSSDDAMDTGKETGNDDKKTTGSTSGTTFVMSDEKEASPFDEKPFKLPAGGVEEQPQPEADDEDDVNDEMTVAESDFSSAGSTATTVCTVTHKLQQADVEEADDANESGSDVSVDGSVYDESVSERNRTLSPAPEERSTVKETGSPAKEPGSPAEDGSDVKDEEPKALEIKDKKEDEEQETDW